MSSLKPAQPSINGWNGAYVEEMYRRFQEDPAALEPRWRAFFEGFDLGARGPGAVAGAGAAAIPHSKQAQVDGLIYHYRDIGHLAADIDPLGVPRPSPEHLTLESFGLSEDDLGASFDPGHMPLPSPAPLRDIVALLRETYCGVIGVEYMHIQDRDRRRWLQSRMEPTRNKPGLTDAEKLRILRELCEADCFETFLHTRFRGKKRFGLDGGETLIPMLDELAEYGPEQGVKEYALAMAHRGRLNVLVNILHKSYDQVFTEFDEAWTEDFVEGGGDVKYHRGYSGDFETAAGKTIRMTLSPNPSHLEFVNSVVLGRTRAKQRLRGDTKREQCVPILIHGDASFPAQGIVAECLNMMRLDGYTVGGAVHVIINNQIGFTTDSRDAFSGRYCTDIAKMVDAPIFHVNGDHPEACVHATRLAIAYRQTFKNDVVVDLWCYRRHGHNEGDEPTFTQPLMYERIQEKVPVVRLYAERLIGEDVITREEFERTYEDIRRRMDEAQARTKTTPVAPTVPGFTSEWSGLAEKYNDDPVETGVPRDLLIQVSHALGTVPEGFALHKKLGKLIEYRRTAVEKDEPLDWGLGELLAYGTLLAEGRAVRLTGQDVERGTFSHRHAVLFDQTTGAGYDPLNHVAPGQARFCVHNSPLTESACVGFEYGYSLGDPNMLIIWEAQFGDFANGAQVIFDQFVASAEVKWKRSSGLVCYLPHGYEGQGPEHSSARLERFLTLCADDDMQVCSPTTPAQLFHVLHRQMKRSFRKPLVLMTPKSLLRHPEAVSRAQDLVVDRFHHLLDDPAVTDARRIRRLLFCSGKIYYELAARRAELRRSDVAIVRLEQLYPFRVESIKPILEKYAGAEEIVWVQEEPKNMGAWRHVDAFLRDNLEMRIKYVGRDANASPAVASTKMHTQQQERILILALGLPNADGEGDERRPRPARREPAARRG